jgi:hypothetical protein
MSNNFVINDIYQSLDAGENSVWAYVNRRNVDELISLASKRHNKALELKFNVFLKMLNTQQ